MSITALDSHRAATAAAPPAERAVMAAAALVDPIGLDELNALAELQTRVLKNFHYVFRADAPWRSFYEGAFDNKPWKTHCGGVTSTMVDALIAAGHPTDKIWRAIVIPATRSANAKAPPVLHMVAIAELDGEFYVLGDTNDLTVYPLSQANFVPTRISQVSEGTVWRSAVRAAPVLVASR